MSSLTIQLHSPCLLMLLEYAASNKLDLPLIPGDRNVWSYSENLKKKVCRRRNRREGRLYRSFSRLMEDGGEWKRKQGLVSDLNEKFLGEMRASAAGSDSNTLSPAAPPLWEIYQRRKWPWLLFLVWFEAWGDSASWEGSTFSVQTCN